MPAAPAEIGSTANNYHILARLAVGGMAEIFLARGASAAGVERYCVLKRILRDRATDVHFVRMFLDEARLAAQLNHPNVAQVYDIGKLGDSYFFTMEYVHGETVRAVQQRARSLRRELPLGTVLTVIAGAASGLHHAHERLGLDGRPLGIVHRDVSPSNLMVGYEGGVKVVDFGVAKAADRMQETRAGTVKGKISYLSPEQCRGAPVDRRTDLFALGIVMWEMLTGERLYRRTSDFENMNAIVNEPPSPPSARRPGVPPEIDAIVLRLLAKDAGARYQTADELVEAIEQAAAATGAMLSSSGLGRLLREMFGQRPEPWLEMDPAEAPEGVTVTSEPVPSELEVAELDSVDLHLAEVPDLSEALPRVATPGDGVPRAVAAQPSSSPHTLTRPGSRAAVVTHLATLSRSDLPAPLPPPPPTTAAPTTPATPAPAGELPLPAPPPTLPEILPNRTHPVAGPDAALRPSAPAVPVPVRPSTPSLSGTQRPSGPSISQAAELQAAIPIAAAGPDAAAQGTEAKPARGWPMFVVIGAAALIGSLTVWLVMRTGGGGAASADAAGVVAGAAGSDVSAAAPAPGPAPVPTITPLPAAPADAAVAAAVPAAAAAPPAGPPSRTPLELAMDARRYGEVVTLCTRQLTPELAASCTLAACYERAEAKARQWFARVPAAGRARVIGPCRGAGIDLAPPQVRRPPAAKPDAGVEDRCEVDPMACQH